MILKKQNLFPSFLPSFLSLALLSRKRILNSRVLRVTLSISFSCLSPYFKKIINATLLPFFSQSAENYAVFFDYIVTRPFYSTDLKQNFVSQASFENSSGALVLSNANVNSRSKLDNFEKTDTIFEFYV